MITLALSTSCVCVCVCFFLLSNKVNFKFSPKNKHHLPSSTHTKATSEPGQENPEHSTAAQFPNPLLATHPSTPPHSSSTQVLSKSKVRETTYCYLEDLLRVLHLKGKTKSKSVCAINYICLFLPYFLLQNYQVTSSAFPRPEFQRKMNQKKQ